MSRRIAQTIYLSLTACWFAFCWVGTMVGIAYHTEWPVAPQIWEGIGIAFIPALLGYLIIFQLFRR